MDDSLHDCIEEHRAILDQTMEATPQSTDERDFQEGHISEHRVSWREYDVANGAQLMDCCIRSTPSRLQGMLRPSCMDRRPQR